MKTLKILNHLKLLIIVPLLIILVGCEGEMTYIGTSEVGRELTADGAGKILPPGTPVRLDHCSIGEVCERLSVMSVAKVTKEIVVVSTYLPESKIPLENIQMDIQFEIMEGPLRVQLWDDTISTPHSENARVTSVSADMLFITHVKGPATATMVKIIKKYDIDKILSDVSEIAEETKIAINAEMNLIGINITRVDFPNGLGTPPQEVIDSKVALFSVEADKARQIAQIEADLVIEKKQQVVQRVRATNNIEIFNKVEKQTSISATDYMWSQTSETFSDSGVPLSLGAGFAAPSTSQSNGE